MFCLRNACLHRLLEITVICFFGNKCIILRPKKRKKLDLEKKNTIDSEEKCNNFISIITFLQNIFIEPGEFRLELELM